MAGSGHASAFYRYTGVDDFVAVATSLYFPWAFLATIPSGFRGKMRI